MDKRLVAAGLVIVVVGIFLIALFWPIFGTTAEQLADDKENNEYESYDEDDKVTIYGTITDKSSVPNWLVDLGVDEGVYIEIDGDMTFLVKGTSEIDFSVGDDIFCGLVLKKESVDMMFQPIVTYEYWQVDGKVRSKPMVDYMFYGITGVGAVVTVAGVIKM